MGHKVSGRPSEDRPGTTIWESVKTGFVLPCRCLSVPVAPPVHAPIVLGPVKCSRAGRAGFAALGGVVAVRLQMGSGLRFIARNNIVNWFDADRDVDDLIAQHRDVIGWHYVRS